MLQRIIKLKNPETRRILDADFIDEQLCYIKHPNQPWPGQKELDKQRDFVFCGMDVKNSLQAIIDLNFQRRLFYEVQADLQHIWNDEEYDLD
jgi:hypothetical protein